jgi:hypothetical protein
MELIHYDLQTIRLNGKEYQFSYFKKMEPKYTVPYGFPTRVYRRGVEHFITDGSTTLRLPLIDSECDRICNREGELARLVALLEIESKK